MKIQLPSLPLIAGPTALRAWQDDDLAALVQACQDEEIVRWTSVPPRYDERDARAYLLQRSEALFAGTAAPFAIVAAEDHDCLLGSISLARFSWQHARAEVGYWLTAPARGQGHATRAVQLISQWAFDALDLERIDLMASTANPGSQAVAERAGYTREAVLRSYMRGKDGRQDMVMFGLLRPPRPRRRLFARLRSAAHK